MNDEGQLYTIEGIAAAALILTTVYLVLNSTMVFTPGDTHVYDMQLEQLGNDVLAVMDQTTMWDPTSGPTESRLEYYIENNYSCAFYRDFQSYSNTKTGARDDTIHLTANISYNNGTTVQSILFTPNASCQLEEYRRENAVVVTRWVNIERSDIPELGEEEQTVLLEVLLWRG